MMTNGDVENLKEQALEVQENESYTNDEAQDEEEYGLCVQCRIREKDFGESSRSVLCSECRKDFLKLRVPVGIKIFLGAVCVVFLFSLYYLPSTVSAYKTYIKAENQMKAREYAFAFNSYYSVLSEYGGSVPVALKTAEAALSAQYLIELNQVVEDHLVGRMLEDADYEKAMGYIGILEAYFATYEEIAYIFGQTEKDIPDVVSAEYVDAVIGQLKALLSKEGMDKTQVYFHMSLIASNEQDQIEYLRLATEQDVAFTYPYSYYGNALRRMGEADEAKQVYEKALSLNACDGLAIRGLGVLKLLEGDKEEALNAIRHAYEIEPFDVYIADSLIVALCENDLREEAMGFMNQFVEQGAEFTDELYRYLDGELSLYQYYMS